MHKKALSELLTRDEVTVYVLPFFYRLCVGVFFANEKKSCKVLTLQKKKEIDGLWGFSMICSSGRCI